MRNNFIYLESGKYYRKAGTSFPTWTGRISSSKRTVLWVEGTAVLINVFGNGMRYVKFTSLFVRVSGCRGITLIVVSLEPVPTIPIEKESCFLLAETPVARRTRKITGRILKGFMVRINFKDRDKMRVKMKCYSFQHIFVGKTSF